MQVMSCFWPVKTHEQVKITSSGYADKVILFMIWWFDLLFRMKLPFWGYLGYNFKYVCIVYCLIGLLSTWKLKWIIFNLTKSIEARQHPENLTTGGGKVLSITSILSIKCKNPLNLPFPPKTLLAGLVPDDPVAAATIPAIPDPFPPETFDALRTTEAMTLRLLPMVAESMEDWADKVPPVWSTLALRTDFQEDLRDLFWSKEKMICLA